LPYDKAVRLAPIAFLVFLCNPSARSQSLATLYVYVDHHTEAKSWRPIFCDSVLVAKLKQGTFFEVNLPPGQDVLSDGKGTPAIIDATAAKPKFIRLSWVYQFGQPPTSVLEVVKENEAQRDMKFLVYIDRNKALAPSVSKTDPRPAPELHLKTRPADEK